MKIDFNKGYSILRSECQRDFIVSIFDNVDPTVWNIIQSEVWSQVYDQVQDAVFRNIHESFSASFIVDVREED